MSPLRALLENLIDYAGLFPPSALPMARAVENYQSYRQSAEAWMLARFVVPVSRLDEFEATLSGPAPLTSALMGADLDADLARIARCPFPIDTIEMKAADAAQIEWAMSRIPRHLTAYIEIADVALIPVIQAAGARAKIRTGGVTPEAFPPAAHIARFLEACAENNTPFKATAGLHHPIRASHPLTYSADSPHAIMHGFINVFVAAAFAWHGNDRGAVIGVLHECDPESFDFSDDTLTWLGCSLTTAQIAAARLEFAHSVGSCSFDEPVAGLRALGWLR
jgi:hypothetical protein